MDEPKTRDGHIFLRKQTTYYKNVMAQEGPKLGI